MIVYIIVFPTGQLMQNESLFNYEDGASTATFSFPSHEPVFLDELLSNLTAEQLSTAQQICGDDQSCLFDLLETQNQALAANSLETNQENIDEQVVSGWPYMYIQVVRKWFTIACQWKKPSALKVARSGKFFDQSKFSHVCQSTCKLCKN